MCCLSHYADMFNIPHINSGMEVLHICNKGSRRNALKEFETYKAQAEDSRDTIKYNLNENPLFESHLLFNTILNRRNRSILIGQSPDNIDDRGEPD